jgi:hypothetical protein
MRLFPLRFPVYADLETAAIYLAPPRSGKTQSLAYRTLEAPGWALVTSGFIDIFRYTAGPRAKDAPVWLLNAYGDGGYASNFQFSPLTGCHVSDAAIEAAGILMNAAPKDANSAVWDGWGAQLLRLAMHAAALTPGATILDARRWVQNPGDREFAKALASPYAAPGWDEELDKVAARPPEMLAGIIASADGALSWLASPTMAKFACPPEDHDFTAENLINSGGTLYLTGRDKPFSSLAPYFALVVSHVFETAMWMASKMEGGRLSPPGTAVLDEAPNICPIDLPGLTSILGGRGIQLVIAAQSPAQMEKRWGPEGSRAILTNCGLRMIFGGFTDPQTLADLSALCDTQLTWRWVKHRDGTRSREESVMPVYPPSKLRLIPAGQALCLHSGSRPFPVRVPRVRDHPAFAELPLNPADAEPQPQPEQLALPAGTATVLPAGDDGDYDVDEVVDAILVDAADYASPRREEGTL